MWEYPALVNNVSRILLIEGAKYSIYQGGEYRIITVKSAENPSSGEGGWVIYIKILPMSVYYAWSKNILIFRWIVS